MRSIFIVLTVIGGILLLLALTAFSYLVPNPEYVLEYMLENPDKSSIYLVRNDSVLAELNGNRKSPLASTMKIVVAITYAEQATSGKIDPNEEILLSDLDRFYLANTDGNAHPNWLNEIQQLSKVVDGKVKLKEVAAGMIQYSSNANTDFLIWKVGLEEVNANLEKLGLSPHDHIFPPAGSLLVPLAFPGLQENGQLNGKVKDMGQEAFAKAAFDFHKRLRTDEVTELKAAFEEIIIDHDFQYLWSNYLPGSSPQAYAGLMKKLNSKTYFSPAIHEQLDPLLERLMTNPANQQWLQHAGMKGGSTLWVLTKASYAKDKAGNTTELAYFFNDLSLLSSQRLQQSMNAFELEVLTNPAFRAKMNEKLGN
ncbi:MAG: class A beta-lactamase-related serine hydrolase [Saprospiraceae bacterium]|nr:class A beta-lactamase-related serine hydrolase [Saprospiraceae bacterium]